MGPVRRGLILAFMPSAAWAEVCGTERPGWDGLPEDGIGEALALFSTLPSLALLIMTALAIRFRSSWGGLAVAVLWTGLVSILAFADIGGVKKQAVVEGCIGSPTLFIGTVAAICVAMILYTAPYAERTD